MKIANEKTFQLNHKLKCRKQNTEIINLNIHIFSSGVNWFLSDWMCSRSIFSGQELSRSVFSILVLSDRVILNPITYL